MLIIHDSYVQTEIPKKARYERFSSKLKNTYTSESLQKKTTILQCKKPGRQTVYLAFSLKIVQNNNWITGKKNQ